MLIFTFLVFGFLVFGKIIDYVFEVDLIYLFFYEWFEKL